MTNPREFSQEVRDAIYGFVYLSEAEWSIVNTPPFQRLRDVKQLAMGHMVYPGAVHTRFEHSIGCVHQADRIIRRLRQNSREIMEGEFVITDGNFERARQLLRLSALLHDVGHPPFSHSGEDLLPTENGNQLSHEDMTAKIIRDTEIGEKIDHWFGADGIDREDVIAVATAASKAKTKPTAYLSILNEMLTSDLGADRIDYLLRDAYHAGQRSGAFDHDRLIREVRLVAMPKEGMGKEGEESPYHLGLDEGGWGVAEQMIAARYLMYTGLYFHKTKRIYEKHLADFMPFVLAEWGGRLPADTASYVKISDSAVWAAISESAFSGPEPQQTLALRFLTRTHMRRAIEVVLADNFIRTPAKARERRVPDRKRFEALALSVRDKYGMRVMVDSPDHSATKMFETRNLLVMLDGVPRYLDDVSEVVGGMSSRIWRGRLYSENEIKVEVADFARHWLTQNPMTVVEGGQK